jgi:hypothetical protein
LEYLAFLVLTPLICVSVPGWFFYEVTVANMASLSDDRSSGLRRWFLVSMPALALASLVPAFAVPKDEWVMVAFSMGTVFLFAVFAAFVFAGEPLGPSRRVLVHWDRVSTSRVRRFLGPGVLRACSLLLMLALAALAVQLGAGTLLVLGKGGPSTADNVTRIVSFGLYSAAFLVFIVGFVAWARARSMSATVPRVLLVGALFLATLGPWLAMAIAGILTDGSDEALLVASPSPTYVFVLMNAIGKSGAERDLALTASAVCAAGWGFLGAGLFAAAGVRARRVVAEHERSLERVESLLRAEDEGPADAAQPEAPND